MAATNSSANIRTCSVDGCNSIRANKKSMCHQHVYQARLKRREDSGIKCRIEGCSDPIKYIKHQLCSSHSKKLYLYGNPESVGANRLNKVNSDRVMKFAQILANDCPHPNTCIDWPFTVNTNGYGVIQEWQNTRIAHRVILSMHLGLSEPPSNDQVARHLCGRPSCVNPRHLAFGTHAENMADVKTHGTQKGSKNPSAKLNESLVWEILNSTESSKSLASKYGVYQGNIRRIRSRLIWKHVDPSAPLSDCINKKCLTTPVLVDLNGASGRS